MDSAKAARNQADIRVNDFSVRSPLDGMVLARPIDSGQVVGLSDVLFQIGSGGAIEKEAEIDEVYASELALGMQAILSPTGKQLRLTNIAPREPAQRREVNPLDAQCA